MEYLNQYERAKQYVRDYYDRIGDWPMIKIVCLSTGVGTGTAHRAIKFVKECVGNT